MKSLFKLDIDYGRMGTLSGVFISTKEKVNKLIESKIEVYFGEVLGKHSEVCEIIEEDYITFITDNPEVIKIVEDYGLISGYNPFDYATTNGEEVDEIIEQMLNE